MGPNKSLSPLLAQVSLLFAGEDETNQQGAERGVAGRAGPGRVWAGAGRSGWGTAARVEGRKVPLSIALTAAQLSSAAFIVRREERNPNPGITAPPASCFHGPLARVRLAQR